MLVNRWRADPGGEANNCSAPVVRPPLAWDYNANRASRFHCTLWQKSGQAMHNSPCVLASDIPTSYLPSTTCDGSVSCACSTGTVTCLAGTTCAAGTYTAAGPRMQLFGVNISGGWGENIFNAWANPPQPVDPHAAHDWWLSSQGHCNNMNGNFTHLGAGQWSVVISNTSQHYWAEGFSKQTAPTGTLIAGSHDPQFSGAAVTFLVNYYDSAGPQAAKLNVDGTCTNMSLQRGTSANGTWSLTQTLSGTSCRRYRFTFTDPAGVTVNLPETGSYGVGGQGTGCADWSASEPTACPGMGNAAPSITAAASATPSPVTGATTSLSALGADDGGEAALSYTWAATGPAAVTYSANGTNAAKATTATFTRVGSYTFTVTARDAQGLTATSSVTVVVQATASTLTVTPATAGVSPLQSVTFTAAVQDQFAQPMSSSVGWAVAGGGTISAGVFTAGSTPGGPFTVTATAGSASGTAQVTVTSGAPPTISTAAAATPSPVTGTTTSLSVLGADDGGEPALTYTWTASGPAAVTYSANGTNAAKTAVATFTRAGSYTFTVTVRDAQGLTATSSVTVAVQATASSLSVTPASAGVAPLQTVTFSASVSDQFTQPLSAPVSWSVTGGGTIAAGVFTADATPGGPFTVTASAGSVLGTAQVTVTSGSPPTLSTAATATPNPVPGSTTALSALGADDGGEAALSYTWAATGPAPVSFSVNASNAAKSSNATFTRAGSYVVTVSVQDLLGLTASSSVPVDVLQTLTALSVAPASAVAQPDQSIGFSASGIDQFGDVMPAAASWAVSGGGTISASGLFTAGAVAGGPHTITATQGVISASASVLIASQPPPLEVQLLQPEAGATVQGFVELAALTNDDSHVILMRFLIDGVEAGTDTTSPFSMSWDASVAAPGAHTIRAEASTGSATALSPEISITVAAVDAPPTVSFEGPHGVVGPSVMLRASASDDLGVSELVFELDGTEIARLSAPPWEAAVDDLPVGSHEVRVTAKDTAGQSAIATGSFTVQALPEEIVGGTCGCTSGGDLLPLWLAMTLLAALRRRVRGGLES